MINFYQCYSDGEILDNYSYMSGFFNICNIRWGGDTKHQLEPYLSLIKKSSRLSYRYARFVIKDRWVEGEPVIMTDVDRAFYYASTFMKGRWIEAEPYIMKDPFYIYLYSTDIIKGRWIEAEDNLKSNMWQWGRYCAVFSI